MFSVCLRCLLFTSNNCVEPASSFSSHIDVFGEPNLTVPLGWIWNFFSFTYTPDNKMKKSSLLWLASFWSERALLRLEVVWWPTLLTEDPSPATLLLALLNLLLFDSFEPGFSVLLFPWSLSRFNVVIDLSWLKVLKDAAPILISSTFLMLNSSCKLSSYD